MYGQAEATTRISYVPHNKIKKKIGSIGIPIKEGKMKIIKVKNSKSDVGEIYYEGPNVCIGYASNFHDLKKKIFGEELYLLEILVKRIGMVIFILLEEKKRFCKILGKSINLDEIENILKKKFKNKSFFAVSNDKLLKIFYFNR